jgi:hypothetical protein
MYFVVVCEIRVVVYGIDHQWQADLVDLAKLSSYNKGFKYLLTCIDVLSRYAWVVPFTDKTGKTLKYAFQVIFNCPFVVSTSVKSRPSSGLLSFCFLVFLGSTSNRGWTLLSFARSRCFCGLSDVSPARKVIRRNKSENGYSLRTRTLCINQLDDDFPGDAL